MTKTSAPGQETSVSSKPMVLIVDDEASTRALLRETVEGLSTPCQISEVVDGDTALKFLRHTRPDLVLLDIVLPGSTTSGVLVCKELCKDSRVKVIVVTGQASKATVNACLDLGAVDHVSKPFSVDAVRAKLERWLAE